MYANVHRELSVPNYENRSIYVYIAAIIVSIDWFVALARLASTSDCMLREHGTSVQTFNNLRLIQ